MKATLRGIQLCLYEDAAAGRPASRLMQYLTDSAVLNAAWAHVCRASGAATAGPDRLSARQLDANPDQVQRFLNDIAQQIEGGSYRPGDVLRFDRPKPGRPDKVRTLVILTLPDRVVHTALKLVLEPLVETRLSRRTFGFRHGRSVFDQLQTVGRLVQEHPEGYSAALCADIADCFDQLDHGLIIEDFQDRVWDPDALKLFRLVLSQVGHGQRGWLRRRHVGVLQGSPLSPLLANWNLARFDSDWSRAHGADAPAFRYADDLLVLARDVKTAAARKRDLERCLRRTNRLELASEKTLVTDFDQGVPLLGLVLRRQCDPFDERPKVRLLLEPHTVQAILDEVHAWAAALDHKRPLGRQFARFSQRLRGWFATYQYAHNAPQAFETIDHHVFQMVKARLKVLTGDSSDDLRGRFLRRLPTGHDTWEADGNFLTVLGSLPRRRYRPHMVGLPWKPRPIERLRPRSGLVQPPTAAATAAGLLPGAAVLEPQPDDDHSAGPPFDTSETAPSLAGPAGGLAPSQARDEPDDLNGSMDLPDTESDGQTGQGSLVEDGLGGR
jgi:RNA-directed DNA polymerase